MCGMHAVVQDKDDDDAEEEERATAVDDADKRQLNGLLNECIILLRTVTAQVDF